MSLDDPQPELGAGDTQGNDDGLPRGDTSWMDPDPPPIPDRIRNAVDPKLPSLPPIPIKQVDHRWLKRGALLAAGVALAGVVWVAWPGPGFADADRQQWEALCDQHTAWFGDFAAAVDYDDKAVLEDVGLGAVVSEVNAANLYAPQHIAQRPDASTDELRDAPPKRVHQPDAITQTRQAHEALQRVAESFDRWPTVVALREHRELFQSHGWTHAANRVQRLLDAAPPHGSGPVGETLRQMVAFASHTGEITSLSLQLEDELDRLAVYDEPVFDRLIAEVRALDHPHRDATSADTAPVGLDALADRLRTLESFAQRFCEFLDSGDYEQINHEDFRARGRAYALLADEDAEAMVIFREWLTENSSYRKVDKDWRLAWAGPQRQALAEIESAAGGLHAGDHPLSKSIDARLKKLNARIDAILDQPLVSGAQLDLQRERESIDRDVAELLAAVDRAGQQVDAQQLIAALREPSSGLGKSPWRSDTVDTQWDAERRRLADQLERRGEQAATEAALLEVRGQLLALIDPSAADALPAALTLTPAEPDTAHAALLAALSQYTAAQREAALKQALANGLPIDARLWSVLVEKESERAVALQTLAEEAGHVERLGELALPLDDPTLPENTKVDAEIKGSTGDDSAGGFAGRIMGWPNHPAWKDPAVAAAGEPLRERVAYVQAIEREDNREVLEHLIAEAPEPSAAFAAWRRWSALPLPTPATAASLAESRALYQRMRKRADQIGRNHADRADVLNAELTEAGRQHWLAAFLSAQAPQEIAAIADGAQAWEVEAEALPTEARFNLLLHRTRDALGLIEKTPQRDAEVLTLAQAFLAQARPMADHPDVETLLDSLATAADPAADHREHLNQAGPGLAGWELLPGKDTRVVTFRRDPWALAFVRIDPPQGPSFYLCTTELPVGLAVAATDLPKVRREWASLLPSAPDGDTRKGPRAWTFASEPNGPGWAVNAGAWLDDAGGYPNGLTPSPPNPRHPVNYLGAEAAAYLAARLGCRLPTIDQWRAAHEAYPVPAGELPNLRDTTWARHAEHRQTLISSGATGLGWANSDVFRPANADPSDPSGDYHPINDGTLWFDPVPESTTVPIELIGNLAELVTTEPVDPAPLLDGEVPMPVRRAAFRDLHKNHFAVLGDSALSPASIRPDEPQPFNVFSGARGYADVGVRLVFVAPKLSPARQARALIEDQAFLQTP